MNDTFVMVVAAAGGQSELARRLSVSRQTVCSWRTRGIPVVRAVEIERILNIPKEAIRPDVFCKRTVDDQTAEAHPYNYASGEQG